MKEVVNIGVSNNNLNAGKSVHKPVLGANKNVYQLPSVSVPPESRCLCLQPEG